jgi:hypothetical protein
MGLLLRNFFVLQVVLLFKTGYKFLIFSSTIKDMNKCLFLDSIPMRIQIQAYEKTFFHPPGNFIPVV